jgi:23S rRNA pseudouridine1911/1915/1917 synthase
MDQSKPRREFVTAPSDAGETLAAFMTRRCPEAPAGFLNRLLRKGFVQINGKPALPGTELRAGQRVTLTLPPGAFLIAPNRDVPFTVLFEDEHLAVVAKPAGVITEPGIGHKLDTLLNGLVARYGEALDRIGPEHDFGLAHRLDKDTSGLLVVARSVAAHGDLCDQFRRRTVEKRYAALVVGRLTRDYGVIESPLGRARQGGRAVGVTQGAETQPAVTTWRVVERFPEATLVEASPKTGRWRQIRLHFESVGHPVAGDPEHGDAKATEQLAARCGLARMFLHAGHLRFRHPVTGRTMDFNLPLPKELREALNRLHGQAQRPASTPAQPPAPQARPAPPPRDGRAPQRRGPRRPENKRNWRTNPGADRREGRRGRR